MRFEVNIDNTEGDVGDTVDIQTVVYYKGEGETVCKTQTLEESTTIGQSPRYKQYCVTFTIDYDAVDNVLEEDDLISILVNLETDTSEVDNIILNHILFRYKTNQVNPEVE